MKCKKEQLYKILRTKSNQELKVNNANKTK